MLESDEFQKWIAKNLDIPLDRVKVLKEPVLFFFKKKTQRKVLEDEAILYDKYCPKCKVGQLIGTWKWSARAYKMFHCNQLNCHYKKTISDLSICLH